MKLRHIKKNKQIQAYIQSQAVERALDLFDTYVYKFNEKMDEGIANLDYLGVLEHPVPDEEVSRSWMESFLQVTKDPTPPHDHGLGAMAIEPEDFSTFVGPRKPLATYETPEGEVKDFRSLPSMMDMLLGNFGKGDNND